MKPETKRRAPVRTNRKEIQEKAMELFLQKGYHGMSTTDLCQALGISRPTLYWYFKDKEDILFSVHQERLESRIQPIIARMKQTVDPLARLRLFIHEYTRVVCLFSDTRVLINETAYLAPEHSDAVRRLWADLLDLLRRTLRELKEDGRIKDVDELFAAFSLIGMVMWTFTWFDHTRPERVTRLIDTIEEIFFAGMLKPGVTWRSSSLGGHTKSPIGLDGHCRIGDVETATTTVSLSRKKKATA